MLRQLRISIVTLVVGLTCLVAGCGLTSPWIDPPQVVSFVDVNRYAGLWYEIARYPTWFQTDCVAVTAEYTLRDNGTIQVVNTCRKRSLDGPVSEISGSARVVDETTNAKLKVSFFVPFEGDYWIIELDEDYQWAAVSNPSRQSLWILSRTPQMKDETYEAILELLTAQGYDLNRLELTPQPEKW